MNEKNVGEVADNIVIFFRAKALSRNSFISTNTYKFAVKKQRLSDRVWAAKTREAGCLRKDTGKEWKKKKNETEKNTLCKRYRMPGIRSTFRYFIIG